MEERKTNLTDEEGKAELACEECGDMPGECRCAERLAKQDRAEYWRAVRG